jgi:vacuolar-type H+-ATPase subunit H
METVEGAAEQVKQTIKEGMNKLDKVKETYQEELSLSKQNMIRIRREIELARHKIDEEKEAVIKRANDHAKAMNWTNKQHIKRNKAISTQA